MTHTYTVCEQRDECRFTMPFDETRLSGNVGCGSTTSRGGYLVRHDNLEEELDPCLSAAVRYKKESNAGLMRAKCFLCCVIVLLSLFLLGVLLALIFGMSSASLAQRVTSIPSANHFVNTERSFDFEAEHIRTANAKARVVTFPPAAKTLLEPSSSTRATQSTATTATIRPSVQQRGRRPQPTSRPIPPSRTTRPKPKMTSSTTLPTATTTKAKLSMSTTAATRVRSNQPVIDCEYYRQSGRESKSYMLSVPGYGEFYAYCQMESDGGWIVLQRRTSGKVPFWNNSIEEYANGFGDYPDGDHWLGLDRVNAFSEHSKKLELRIRILGDLCESPKGLKKCTGYGESGHWWGDWEFTLGNRSDGYRIKELKYVRGNLSDPSNPEREKEVFSHLCNNQQFTTVDVDLDTNSQQNCASFRKRGAWWHQDCAHTVLNGLYGVRDNKATGQFWHWNPPLQDALVQSPHLIKPRESMILFRILEP